MKVKETVKYIEKGKFDSDFTLLYGSAAPARERYKKTCAEFEKLFDGNRDVRLFSAPGRTEVGGNHTDHQHGCVLAGSVNLDVIAVVALNNDGVVRIKSEGFPMDTIELDKLVPQESETGKAASLIRGMCAYMKEAGCALSGFDAYTTSNVLKGSGLSSSAAFEVLVGVIINNLFGNAEISAVDIAKYAQKAENVFFGKPCGLMDQMASSVGGFTSIDFNDVSAPIIKKIDFNIAEREHSLCIVNTGGNHADLTEDYADITIADKNVSHFFGKEVLRDVDENEFFGNIAKLRESCGDKAVLAAIHFFADNKRAIDEAKALENGEFQRFLSLINESGDSSFKYLQNVYSPRHYNEQGLSIALAVSEKVLGGRGACRVHGGGFAGTIQAFVPNDILDNYISAMEDIFGKDNCYVLNIRPVGGYALKI